MVHKTDWKLKDTVKPEDLNRIEKNNSELESPTFDDTGTVSDINSFTDFINSVKSRMNIFEFFKNFKAGLKYIVHQGQIINSQDVTQAGFALDARQANPNISGTLGAKISDLNNNINFYKIVESPQTIESLVSNAEKNSHYAVIATYFPEDLPAKNAECWIDIKVESNGRKLVFVSTSQSAATYKRVWFSGWKSEWIQYITSSDLSTKADIITFTLNPLSSIQIGEKYNNDIIFMLSGIGWTGGAYFNYIITSYGLGGERTHISKLQEGNVVIEAINGSASVKITSKEDIAIKCSVLILSGTKDNFYYK